MKSHDDQASGQAHSHPTPAMLGITFVYLCIGMALTMAVYYVDLGHILASKMRPGDEQLGSLINNVVALTIAMVKATLVVQTFMGVRFGSNLVKMWAYMGFVTLPLMLIMFGDFGTRHWEEGTSWTNPGKEVAPFRSDVDLTFRELNEKYGHKSDHGATGDHAPEGDHESGKNEAPGSHEPNSAAH